MKTIVMTGGTGGLGAVAARRIAAAPDTRLILGSRGSAQRGFETVPLDLRRLADARSFASDVLERVDAIDALVLNAGRSGHADEPTDDGFEVTFAVNHLAQYLLLRLLEDRLAPGATVVLTTSSTHDPARKAPIPPPRHADARLLAHPDRDPDRDTEPRAAHGRAYTASKLCNVLTARALAERRPALTVIAFDPGRTPGTGLMRDQGRAVDALWRLLGTGALWRLIPQANSAEAAGTALADLALNAIAPPPGRIYGSLRRGGMEWTEPSTLALDDDAMRALWRDSAELTGVPATEVMDREGSW